MTPIREGADGVLRPANGKRIELEDQHDRVPKIRQSFPPTICRLGMGASQSRDVERILGR